jgi:N-hydroxyarylamine O-acetyltransferase
MKDLDAYLRRIGLEGEPTVAQIHRAHATTIPFENLDPQRGLAPSLGLDDLERKLVRERRGGYCFEHNLLLTGALRELGCEVDWLLARVRMGAAEGQVRPRSHLVLRVRKGGEDWLADVGFGMGTLLEPLPFAIGAVEDQAGWRVRLRRDGAELVLQAAEGEEWSDLYGFLEDPVPLVDIEVGNWWTATHPGSPFVSGLIVATQDGQGSRTSLSDWNGLALSEQTPTTRTSTPVERVEVPALLATHFGLDGFALHPSGRLVREDDL